MEARSGSSSRPKFRCSWIRTTKNNQQLLPEATSTRPTNGPTLNPHEHPQHHKAALPQEHNVLPQGHNALPQGPNILPQGHNALPQGPTRCLSGATPSSVWPSNLIPILCRIAALPSRQPLKPLFDFSFSLEAANKNFIILKRKFGGDLSKALLAQSDSPLGY